MKVTLEPCYNLRRRDSNYSRHWWIGCNLTFLFRVDEDDFLRFCSVERQVADSRENQTGSLGHQVLWRFGVGDRLSEKMPLRNICGLNGVYAGCLPRVSDTEGLKMVCVALQELTVTCVVSSDIW